MPPVPEDVLSAVYDELAFGVCVIVRTPDAGEGSDGRGDESAGSSGIETTPPPTEEGTVRIYANPAWFTELGCSMLSEWLDGGGDTPEIDNTSSLEVIRNDGSTVNASILSSTPAPRAPTPTDCLHSTNQVELEVIEQAFLHSGTIISCILAETVSEKKRRVTWRKTRGGKRGSFHRLPAVRRHAYSNMNGTSAREHGCTSPFLLFSLSLHDGFFPRATTDYCQILFLGEFYSLLSLSLTLTLHGPRAKAIVNGAICMKPIGRGHFVFQLL